MPPPSEHPLPRPKPKPPKPRPKQKQKAIKPAEPVRVQSHGGVPFPPDPFACAAQCSDACSYYRLCPPPPPSSRAATVHLRSSRLPTPLVALSASVLAVSAVLLLILLICHVVRRRTRRRQQQQETPLVHLVDEEGAPVPAVAAEEGGEGAGPGVHHVWYIRTVGLDERAIATITALVYNAEKCRTDGGDDYGSCTVCLAEFRDGETLRLLPRCRHAFHRGCIDTWLRAHVNCPLCRAPVQVATANAVPGATPVAPGGEPAASLGSVEADRDGALTERAVRRAASMVALPRLPWPDASLRAPASSSWREEETGLVKISRLLKLSEALEMTGVGVGRSVSFRAGRAESCQHFTGPSGPSATGTNADEVSR